MRRSVASLLRSFLDSFGITLCFLLCLLAIWHVHMAARRFRQWWELRKVK